MVVAIILAGGVGSRLGKGIPKQFVEVLGKPIMAYTIEKFEKNPNIDAIEIVSHKDYIEQCRSLSEKYGFTKVRWFVNGGDSFPESTVNGLVFLKDKIDDDDIVMVHGSCAPLVTDEVINDGISVCKKKLNAMAIQQMCLSTCLKDDETCSSRSIDRETIVQVQFPLTFQYKYIMDAYDKVIEDGSFGQLGLHLQYAVFANGGTMHFSKGDDRNFKITTQAELDFFEGYLLLQEKRRNEV
jgi:2-C-methyl-D-erythritol 4-phosphate cytidylyltransferase